MKNQKANIKSDKAKMVAFLFKKIRKKALLPNLFLPFDFSLLPFDFLTFGLGGRNRTCVDLFPKQAGGLYPTPRKSMKAERGTMKNNRQNFRLYSSFIAQTSAFKTGGIGGI